MISYLPMGVFGPGLWSRLKSLVEFHFLDPDRLRLDIDPLSGRWFGVMGVAWADALDDDADGGGMLLCMAAVR